MRKIKKLITACIAVFVLLFSFGCDSKSTQLSETDIQKIIGSVNINLSNEYEIVYQDSDFIEETNGTLVLKTSSKIKIIPTINTIGTTNVSFENKTIKGFQVNRNYYETDYFDKHYITLENDITINPDYETFNLFAVIVYQNTNNSEEWLNLLETPTELEKMITINTDNVTTSNTFLIYATFADDKINSNTNSKTVNDSKLTVYLELFLETTDVVSALVYKSENETLVFENYLNCSVDDCKVLYDLNDYQIILDKSLAFRADI